MTVGVGAAVTAAGGGAELFVSGRAAPRMPRLRAPRATRASSQTHHFCPTGRLRLRAVVFLLTGAPQATVECTPTAKMAAGKTSLTIGWKKIEGADGYDIFFSRCNHSGKKMVCKYKI